MSFFTSPLALNSSSMNAQTQPNPLSLTTQSLIIQQLQQRANLLSAQQLFLQNPHTSSLSELPLTKKVKPQEPKTKTNVILQSSFDNMSSDSLSRKSNGIWKTPACREKSEVEKSMGPHTPIVSRPVEPMRIPSHILDANLSLRNQALERQLLALRMLSLTEQMKRLSEQQDRNLMVAKATPVAQSQNTENFGSPLSKASTESRTVQSPGQVDSSDCGKIGKEIKSNIKDKMEDFDTQIYSSFETHKSSGKKSKASARSNESRITRKRLQKQIEKLENATAFLDQTADSKDAGRRMNTLQTLKTQQEQEEQLILEESSHPDMSRYLRCEEDPTIRVGSGFQALIPSRDSERPRRELKTCWDPSTVEENYQRDFVEKLENIIGYKQICDEKAMRLLIRYKLDAEKALESVSKNKTYYKNLLSAECKKYVKELKKIN